MTIIHIISLSLVISTLFYVAVLVYLSAGFRAIMKQSRSAKKEFVTVIISAHNEEHNLPDCIVHLKNQDYPQDKVEFILVNDRSTDRTEAIMQLASERDKRFRTLTVTDRLPDFAPKKRAIDTAIRQANGDIILLTDADGRPVPKWISAMSSYFTEDTDMVLGYAPYKIKPAKHFIKQILALEYLSHAAVALATTGLHFPITCVGTNLAYRKKMYLDIGGFGEFKNQISGDDDLFLTRVREQKRFTIAYAAHADAQVFNNPPQLWSKFLHQRMRYASKGFKYPFKVTAGLIIYVLFNLQFFLVSFGIFFNSTFIPPFLASVLVKWLSEYLFMHKSGRLLGDLRHFKVFPIASLLHIPYVVIFAILGQFDYFKWAEHKAEPGTQGMRN